MLPQYVLARTKAKLPGIVEECKAQKAKGEPVLLYTHSYGGGIMEVLRDGLRAAGRDLHRQGGDHARAEKESERAVHQAGQLHPPTDRRADCVADHRDGGRRTAEGVPGAGGQPAADDARRVAPAPGVMIDRFCSTRAMFIARWMSVWVVPQSE